MKAFQFTVDETEIGTRLDKWLATQLPDVSRTQVQRLIEKELVSVNDKIEKGSFQVKENDLISVVFPEPEVWRIEPEAGELEILYEDEDLLIVNKPVGLVVHPAPGHPRGTLVNLLLNHCKDLSGIGGVLRPGIVHRLDAGTSGILVVAKNDLSHRNLSDQFRKHTILRQYIALVFGNVNPNQGVIEAAIGRSPHDRKKMAAVEWGKPSITEWKLLAQFPQIAHLRLTLKTGRTHQIRVHLTSKGWGIIGDSLYGGGKGRVKSIQNPKIKSALQTINHPLLHAERLGFTHPKNGKEMMFFTPPPKDFQHLLEILHGA
ncbi:MAG TPA: RluA family pseudouridine synthase [Bdellovibrionota bacterium]|nr:RluA family pseudouridine synthase [Bdellovibrionota bacterium]